MWSQLLPMSFRWSRWVRGPIQIKQVWPSIWTTWSSKSHLYKDREEGVRRAVHPVEQTLLQNYSVRSVSPISWQSIMPLVSLTLPTSTVFISAQSTSQFVTVRGCFPLDLHTFPEGLQRTSVREYWDVSLIIMIMVMKTIWWSTFSWSWSWRQFDDSPSSLIIMIMIMKTLWWSTFQGDNLFAVCDYDGCNSASSLKVELVTTIVLLLVGPAWIKIWLLPMLIRSLVNLIICYLISYRRQWHQLYTFRYYRNHTQMTYLIHLLLLCLILDKSAAIKWD